MASLLGPGTPILFLAAARVNPGGAKVSSERRVGEAAAGALGDDVGEGAAEAACLGLERIPVDGRRRSRPRALPEQQQRARASEARRLSEDALDQVVVHVGG